MGGNKEIICSGVKSRQHRKSPDMLKHACVSIDYHCTDAYIMIYVGDNQALETNRSLYMHQYSDNLWVGSFMLTRGTGLGLYAYRIDLRNQDPVLRM
jgi:hypothetical protein